MEDIFIASTDNLTGFSAAIEAVFPKTEIQNCIIHQIHSQNNNRIKNMISKSVTKGGPQS